MYTNINRLRTKFFSVGKYHVSFSSWMLAHVSLSMAPLQQLKCVLTDVPNKRGCHPQALCKVGYGNNGE